MNKVIPREVKQVVERGFKLLILTPHYRLFLQCFSLPFFSKFCVLPHNTSYFQFWGKAFIQIHWQTLAYSGWVISSVFFCVPPKLREKGCFLSDFSMLYGLSSPSNLKEPYKHIYRTEGHSFFSIPVSPFSFPFSLLALEKPWRAHPYRHNLFFFFLSMPYLKKNCKKLMM